MTGGAGNDIYVVDNSSDVVTETTGNGTDEVRTSLTGYTLGNYVENLTYTGTAAFTGSGNALDNIITSSSGNDVLYGEAGNDIILAGTGDDVLEGGDGDDTLDGQGGQNWFITGSGQDNIVFNSNSGFLHVYDFSDGNDRIDMRGTGITLANAAANVTITEFTEGGVLVAFGDDEIWLEGIMPGTVTFANDFRF